MLSKTPAQTRVVFFGTPELAVPSLAALFKADFKVVAAVTQPDKPVGRKQVINTSPVKRWAVEHDVPVIQPEKIRTPEFLTWLQAQHPDVCVVVAYGKIFPASVLSIPPLGFVNLHPSLLPELRGATPMPFAILRGYTETGVTIMKMDEGMDTGPIFLQTKIDVPQTTTTLWLQQRLQELGASALVTALTQYVAGNLSPTLQPPGGTVTTLLSRADGEVTWEVGAQKIDALWRAFFPFPGVTIIMDNLRLKLIEVEYQDGKLLIKKIQPEGKSVMSGAAFKRGVQSLPLPGWVVFGD